MNEQIEPQLAPPGAGLPPLELFFGRNLFALRRWTGNREQFDATFREEYEKIGKLISGLGDAKGSRRVLIKRPRGLEDSSRYWSVWMTLDHLRIVNGEITRVITGLTKGLIPSGKASTANVKPSIETTASIVPRYEAACMALLQTTKAITDLKTKTRYAHPWFGPLDASGWHALAGTHMGMHCVQIERILESLP